MSMPTSPALNHSQRVRAADFDADWFKDRAREMDLEIDRYHRKIWEDVVIAQVFVDHVLMPASARYRKSKAPQNLSALGFGCGKEPIPKWLARTECVSRIIATDAPGINPAWDATNQRAHNLSDLGIGSDNKLVEFREVDMNAIPEDLLIGEFDFTWSCGSFEHIGGINRGLEFFRSQMRCLKPGGIACHTTELNIDLDAITTLEADNLSFFRFYDLMGLAGVLWENGDRLWSPDFKQGDTEIDRFVDRPPYTAPYHLNIEIGEFVTTSVVLIATRGQHGDTRS